MMKILFLGFLFFAGSLFGQELITPLEKNNYKKVTSYDELSKFVYLLDQNSDLVKVETIGKSVEGRNIYSLNFSTSGFGKDKTKVKVLIFAQQHGNEQSGKEGVLLLAEILTRTEYRYLFDRIDLVLIPQVNPDGSEKNQRRNGNDVDLNRNHLILTEPETRALHWLFDQYLFEVAMDVHEYYPYDESWMKYGYRKNADVTLGATTNINVSEKIRNLSNNKYIPFALKYLNDHNYSSMEYCPGGPPSENYLRHSTFDINDGRQSFGIQNTLSFIQEGMNGEDNFVQNIKHRAEGQMTGMLCLLKFVYHQKKKIKNLVTIERENFVSEKCGELVSVQMEHAENNEKLTLPVYALYSKSDSMVITDNYRPIVKSLKTVTRPRGYLIPRDLKEVVDWLNLQGIIHEEFYFSNETVIEQYFISKIDSIDFEGDKIVNAIVEVKEIYESISPDDYFFIPVAQLKANMIIQALEPQSMLGLATYSDFKYLIEPGKAFPILRLIPKRPQ